KLRRDGILQRLSLGLRFGDAKEPFRNRIQVSQTETAILNDIEQGKGVRSVVKNLPVLLLAPLQVAECHQAPPAVWQPPADPFKKSLLLLCPNPFIRALVKPEEPWLARLWVDHHRNLRSYLKSRCFIAQLMFVGAEVSHRTRRRPHLAEHFRHERIHRY